MRLDLDAVAALPGRGPWAVQVLAAALGEGAAPGEAVAWPGAPAAAQALAAGISGGGGRWSMWTPDRARWGLVLSPARPCACLADVRQNAFTLMISDHGLGYGLWWEEGQAEARVDWFDEEDGATAARGTLEGWCQRLLEEWLFRFEGEEPAHDLPRLSQEGERSLRGFLGRLGLRREALAAALARSVAACEAEVLSRESSGLDATAAYAAWLEADARLAGLGVAPWGYLVTPESEEDWGEDLS